MKRLFFCMLAAALLLAGALAEEHSSCWTLREDMYYHVNPACRGMEDAVPISEEAAQAFAKHRCPVCIAEDDGGKEVQAAVRGGTIVLRFSDAWLAQKELTGVFGWSGDSVYRGREGEELISEYLHGEDYNSFMQAYRNEGSAAARARIPYILAKDGELVMSRRHIGGAWYAVVRPQARFGDSWKMYWRINGMNLRMENGELRSNFDRQTVEDYMEVSLERMSGTETVYDLSKDDLELAVYKALDTNVAVLFKKNADDSNLKGMELHIGNAAIELSGYMDGGRAVYCCVLTDGELNCLKGGEPVRLVRKEKINSSIYRTMDGEMHRYYSRESGELLLETVAVEGADSLDYNYRVLVDGEPERFVLHQTDGDGMMDMHGRCVFGLEGEHAPRRITPLIWSENRGVFLVEYCAADTLKPGERALEGGVVYEKRYSLKERDDSWCCCFVDQDGSLIGPEKCVAFKIRENGEIHAEDDQGEVTVVQPIILND